MEINLRKARKIESSLVNYLSEELSLDSKASIRSLGNLEQAHESIANKRNELFSFVELRETIFKLIYKIRREIEIKNEEAGINSLINKKVLNLKILEDIQKIDKNETPSSEELQDMLHASSKNLTSSNDADTYFRKTPSSPKTSFSVSCLSKDNLDFLADKRASLNKEQQKIDEEISYLNITKTIILTEKDTKILEMCKLL
jgi:hypothetical protein